MPPIIDGVARLRDARRDVRRAPRGVGRVARDACLLARPRDALVDLDEPRATAPQLRCVRISSCPARPSRSRSASSALEPEDRLAEPAGVALLDQQAVDVGPHEIGETADVRCDEGSRGGQRLESDVGKPVDVPAVSHRRHGDHVGGGEVAAISSRCALPVNTTRPPMPRRAASCSRSSLAVPSPTSTSRSSGRVREASAYASRRTSKPFTGMRRPSPMTTTSSGAMPSFVRTDVAVPAGATRASTSAPYGTSSSARCAQAAGPTEQIPARRGDGRCALEGPARAARREAGPLRHRQVRPMEAHDERGATTGDECTDGPVGNHPVDVNHVEATLVEESAAGSRRRCEHDRRKRVERLADADAALERRGEAPRSPRRHGRVAVDVVVDGAFALRASPVAVLRNEHVHFVPEVRDTADDRLDERRRRVARVARVRGGDREDLHAPALSAGLLRPCARFAPARRRAPRAAT